MATARVMKHDGSFTDETFTVPDDELETPMIDKNQEQQQDAMVSLTPKLMQLTDNEMKALFWLSIAYVHEQDQLRRIRQRVAIETLLGSLTIGEWLALGPSLGGWIEAQS